MRSESASVSWILRDCPAWVAIAAGALFGLTYAVVLLGPGVAFGWSDYWAQPHGLQSGRFDMTGILSAWHWFMQDRWRWPLLAIPKAADSNAGLWDPVALIFLLSKAIQSATGWKLNPMPLWQSGCFAANAAALVILVRALGARSFAAALLAAGLGAMAPGVHMRHGHLSLLAHWLPISALALYVHTRALPRVGTGKLAGVVGLAALAAGINLYLFVMVVAIGAAAILQPALDRRAAWGPALLALAALPASGGLVTWAIGLLEAPSVGRVTFAFGRNSMNLLSPFWPQSSGVLSGTGIYWLTRGSIGATVGQYDGYAYLGLGAVLTVVMGVVLGRDRLVRLVRDNAVLTAAMLVLTLWALSNQIYAGPFLIVTYPVPDILERTVLAWFRSSGRMFWPVAWLIVGIGIAAVMTRAAPRTRIVVLAVVLVVQWVDLSIWRGRIATLVARPAAAALAPPDVMDRLLQEARVLGHVALVPVGLCPGSSIDDLSYSNAITEAELLAALANARINVVANARETPTCGMDTGVSLPDMARQGVLIVLRDVPGLDRTEEARHAADCMDLPMGVACTPRK